MSPVVSSTAITLKNILVATDLSPASLRSLPYVVELARQYGSNVYLGHVIPMEIYGVARPDSLANVEAECFDYAQFELGKLSTAVGTKGISAQVLLTAGDAGVVIPEWVSEHKVDLLVVGTTGRSGLSKLLLGSIAEELIREALSPVLVVGPKVPNEAPPRARNILWATDFSPSALHAGQYACSMACHDAARVITVHVTDAAAGPASHQSLQEKLRDSIPEDLALSIASEQLVAQGRPAAKILEIADQHAVDLIVIGAHGAGGLGRAASHFGSTAHDVIVGAHCPVLVVPG